MQLQQQQSPLIGRLNKVSQTALTTSFIVPNSGPNAAQLLTRKQAADYIGVKPHTLAAWACNRRYDLVYVKIGRLVKYRKADLDAFIQKNTQGAENE